MSPPKRGFELLRDAGLRRVRPAARRPFRGLECSVKLPKGVTKPLTKALQALGAVRDCDSVGETLRGAGGPASDEAVLSPLLAQAASLRPGRLAAAREVLQAKPLAKALRSLERAAAEPQLLPLGRQPVVDVAPSLLTAQLSALFLHAGWQVEVFAPLPLLQRPAGWGAPAGSAPRPRKAEGTTVNIRRKPWERALGVDRRRCETVHELRKGIREIRYSMEFFSPLYRASPAFEARIASLVSIQTTLGCMHDIEVCLETVPAATKQPALVAVLRADYERLWETFQATRASMAGSPAKASWLGALMEVPLPDA